MASPLQGIKIPDLKNQAPSLQENAFVEYDFYTVTTSLPKLAVYTLPTHPVNNNYRMRYAVSVDNGPLKVVDFKMQGRSEEWKQNVLS